MKNLGEFLTYFPDHCYRYIDQTGEGRLPVACAERNDELNLKGYESYFTVNGFKDAPNAQKEHCSSLNAFFVDIDGRKDLQELEEIEKKLDPTFILETMNGYHIYWCLDEPIYRDDMTPEEWDTVVARWERIEQAIVLDLKADPVVKDLTRILRVPDTYYWKKTGDKWKSGIEGVFKIKGIYKKTLNNYTLDTVESIFPVVEQALEFARPTTVRAKNMSDAEKKNFFDKVNEEYPIEERDSFTKLISNNPESLPAEGMRNKALLITASLMRQAGWTFDKAVKHITKTGWHGIETERGGMQEIQNTIKSAYEGGYTYSHKNEIISYNMSPEENQRIQEAYAVVLKSRKEKDKIRFSTYEHELLARHPHLKKNDVGIIFQYVEGVYKRVSDIELSDMVLNGLYEDMLWGYRTNKNVSDKVSCLISIIPFLIISDDKGYIINVKNGLLNLYSRELLPHTPNFVSLIQYPVVYDPEAEAPVWNECIKDWMSGPEQEEKTRLIQQFCGYILSSSMLYDRALFLVGDGGNGKSTFIDTIAMVLGPEATSHIDLEDLYSTFGMDGLIGKRLNIIEEVSGNYYQSNKLKKLISGEPVSINIKYKPQFKLKPQAKFVFSVNLLPRVDDTSTATERRMCAVQFLNNYRKNPNFKLRSSVGLLAQELSGILNWMIEGALDLAENKNFIITKEQTRMLDDYREENSSVEGFLSQCIILEPTANISVPTLYAEYKRWSQSDGGRKIKSNITFTKEVKAYGAKDDRFTYKPRQYAGLEASFEGIDFSPHWLKQSEWVDGVRTGGFRE